MNKILNLRISFLFVLLFSFNTICGSGIYRQNLALRHPCNQINKRLQPYIAWTEKLASSQYKVQRDACGHISTDPACCTNELMQSYESSLGDTLKQLFDKELDNLEQLVASSRRKINLWSKEYITESHRLTISSLETLFDTREYQLNIHNSVSNLYNVLSDTQSSVDDVSKSTINLFSHLIVSLYRRFMMKDTNYMLDGESQKCLINAGYEAEAFPSQRELLYVLTGASALMQVFGTMLTYIEADIQRLKTMTTMHSNTCIQRFSRETLCPICISGTSSISNTNRNVYYINEILCENDCRYVIKTCFNQTNNPYVAFSLAAKGYSNIIKDIEHSIVELKLVDRLSKLHIYFYDMVVNATNSRRVYSKIQSVCPQLSTKPFNPILSFPPTVIERREHVLHWNKSLHALVKQVQSSIDNLYMKLTQKIIGDFCSNTKYASKSNRCTQIDKQMANYLIQWPLPIMSQPTMTNIDNGELTHNQLDELRKKMIPIQQIVLSLQPKKKYSLFEFLPDFESYDDDLNVSYADENDHVDQKDNNRFSIPFIETSSEQSLSEQLYQAIDGESSTRQTFIRTTKTIERKTTSNGQPLTYNIGLYFLIFIINRIITIDQRIK